ncbi:MAG: PAS domain S-box protein [Candidatus Omnitrophica bacterium]|nr:PAS domain S-box protein [Candidatus Omnitrophota bacterium]
MKKRNILKILKTKRYLIAYILTIVMITGSGLVLGKFFNNLARQEVVKSTEEKAKLVVNYLENVLNETDYIVSLLANSRSIINMFGSEGFKLLKPVNETLDRYDKGKELICYLMDINGLTIASSNRADENSFVGKNYKFRPYFKEAVKGKSNSYFALGVTSGKRGYYSSAPVKNLEGKIIGVAVVKKIFDIDEKHFKGFKDYLFVNADGIVFLSSNPEYLFKSLHPLNEKQKDRIKAARQFGAGPFQTLLKGPIKKGDIVILDSEKKMVVAVPVGNDGWRVVFFQTIGNIILHDLLIIISFSISIILASVFFYFIQQKNKLMKSLRRSEQRYTSIFDTGPQVTIIFDANTKVIACSRRIENILGYTVKEMIGKTGFEFILNPDKLKWMLEEVEQEGATKSSVIKAVHKNGSILDVSFSAALMPGRLEKEQRNMFCVVEDVTERLKNITHLRESKEQCEQAAKEYKLAQEATLNILEDLQDAKNSVEADRKGFLDIIENSWGGIIIVDNNGLVRFVNESAQRICDSDKTKMIDRPFAYAVNADEVNRVKIKQKDGKNVLVEIRVTQTEWLQQKMNLFVLHDITEQEESKSMLLRAAEEWRSTFDAIGDGVSLLNNAGRVIRCNSAATMIFGKRFPDVLSIDCHEFFYGDQKDSDCVIENTISSGKRSTQICNKDGRWYLLSADPLVNEGKVTGIVHTMSDVTEQKNAEDKIKEDSEYIESIVETAQALIIVLDREFKIKSINKFAEDMLGYKREDIIGSNWIDLVIPLQYKDEIQQVFLNCFEGDRVRGYEIPVIAKDAKESIISWYSAELQDADGKIIGVVTMGYDVSQRKEIEKVQRLAQLGTLVSHMAHEVNNPLMVISGRAQLSLMEEIQNQEVKDNLEVVLKECKRAKDIIQRLLRFSRPSKGELKEVDINKSLEEVVSLLAHQFKLENVNILSEITPNLSPIRGDEKQLQEVFMNLLTNAQDAIAGEGSVKIKAKEKDGFIKITFEDTGEGISKKVLEKIFDPFFTTKKEGTGLGLAICYGIIKAHNGSLEFKSIEGKGATAIILLPVLKDIL